MWNGIEHRLFGPYLYQLARPAATQPQTVVDPLASTTTSAGAEGLRAPGHNTYATKIRVSDDQMQAVQLAGEEPQPSHLGVPYSLTP